MSDQNERDYSYCKLFVKESSKARIELVARDVVPPSGISVEVRRNRDFSTPAGEQWKAGHAADFSNPDDDFILWPNLIEVYIEDGSTFHSSEVVRTVTALLSILWSMNCPTVAACEFEDELPWSGGIKRLEFRQ